MIANWSGRSDQGTVLIVEDDEGLACLIRASLEEGGFACLLASTGGAALRRLREGPPDLMILDYSLPDMNGMDLVKTLSAGPLGVPPYVMITGREDTRLAVSIMKHGARDYLVKDVEFLDRLPSVVARVKKEADTEKRLSLAEKALRDSEARLITERRKAESEIQQLAFYDALTGLPNRTLCQDRLKQAIAQAHRERRLVGVLFLDLDRFKSINDTLGHLCGDRVLKTMAERISRIVRESDTVARFGGDEFAVIFTAVTRAQDVHEMAGKILAELAVPLQLDAHEIFTTGSIGVAIYPMDGEDVDTLLKNADIAMYKAKELDKNNCQFFSSEMNLKIVERLMLEGSLRRALARSEFSLVYQPQIDVNTGSIIAMEALIRWQHPEMGMIPPDTFISVAEETGMILPIGEWVLRTACARNKAWQSAGFVKLRVAVNLSARQFKQKDLVEMIAAVLAETGLDAEFLELELTESTVMTNALDAAHTLRRLKEMGICLTIDDFGTGYSSLSYLKHFSMDRLKIDQSFVHDISTNPDDAAIAEAIIAMGHSLNLRVIAEGVESKGQLEFLRTRNCDEIQGFLLGRPLSEDAFTEMLRAESVLSG